MIKLFIRINIIKRSFVQFIENENKNYETKFKPIRVNTIHRTLGEESKLLNISPLPLPKHIVSLWFSSSITPDTNKEPCC